MISISFMVKAVTQFEDQVKVVGCLPSLGEWDPKNAAPLVYVQNEMWQSEQPIKVSRNKKFEFKIIRIKKNGKIEWQPLPNNANRRFRTNYTSQLIIEWSEIHGKQRSNPRSIKIGKMPNIMIKQKKNISPTKEKGTERFNPFIIASNVDSDQSEEEFEFMGRKKSEDLEISDKELEGIYFDNGGVENLISASRKTKVYLISSQYSQVDSFYHQIEKEVDKLPAEYQVRWLNLENIIEHKARINVKLRKEGSLFEMKSEGINLDDIFTKPGYFIFLEATLPQKILECYPNLLCSLFLKSSQYLKVLSHIRQLSLVKFICFEEASQNRQIYQFMKSKSEIDEKLKNQIENQIIMKDPSLMCVINELLEFKMEVDVNTNSLSCIGEKESLEELVADNSILLVDGSLVEKQKNFFSELLTKINPKCFIILLADQMTQEMQEFEEHKNVIFSLQNSSKMIIEGKLYSPLQKINEIIEIIKLKGQIYLENYGCSLTAKDGFVIYQFPPQTNTNILQKIQRQMRMIVKDFNLFKISRKDQLIKVGWNLASEVRLIRTVCELRRINWGKTAVVNILSYENALGKVKEEVQMLVDYKKELFEEEVRINHYSYDIHLRNCCTITANK